MRIGYIQFHPLFGDRTFNVATLERLACTVDADLLMMPELATSGYTFTSLDEVRSLAEPFDASPSLDRLQRLARERSCAIVVGFPELAGNRIFNSAALLRPDGTRECYRKVHLFNTETLFFSPGDQPFAIHDLHGVKLGIIICFDWYFPESIRTLALLGAQVICQPANLVLQWCQYSMVTRSIENRVFTVTANRYGTEDRGPYAFTFTGASQITTPAGDVLAKAPEASDHAAVVEIDPTKAMDKHVTPHTDLFAVRRPSYYRILTANDMPPTGGDTA